MFSAKRFPAFAALPLLFMVFAIVAVAQDNMGMSNQQTMSVTGCLKQGADSGGYYLMGDDGKMYELMGKGLAAHVNHKVTVTGTQQTLSQAQEEKKMATEKSEANGATVVDMKVSSVKMVSESCQ